MNWLPIVAKIVSAIAVLGGVGFFLLAYRRSKRIGYLVLAVAAVLPMANLRISTQSQSESQRHAMPADAQYGPARPVIVTHTPVTIPLVSLFIGGGAYLLYRDEKKKPGPGAGDRAGGSP